MPTPQNWTGPAICTPADIRSHLRGIPLGDIALEDGDPLAERLCKTATRRAVSYCQRVFAPTTYESEKYHGTGRFGNITLMNYPVIRVEKIVSWNKFRTYKRELLSSDEDKKFTLQRDYGIIELVPDILDWLLAFQGHDYNDGFFNIGFPASQWNVEVTYIAGYDPYPEDLVDAVAMMGATLVLDELSANKTDGVNSFSADGISVSFGEKGAYGARKSFLQDQYKEILDFYRRRSVGSI